MSHEKHQPLPIEVMGAQALLHRAAKNHRESITEAVSGRVKQLHVGKNIVELPQDEFIDDPDGHPPIQLIIDYKKGPSPKSHKKIVPVWRGIEIPNITVPLRLTIGGVLESTFVVPEDPSIVYGTAIASGDGKKRYHKQVIKLKEGQVIAIPRGMPYGHEPSQRGKIAAALVMNIQPLPPTDATR